MTIKTPTYSRIRAGLMSIISDMSDIVYGNVHSSVDQTLKSFFNVCYERDVKLAEINQIIHDINLLYKKIIQEDCFYTYENEKLKKINQSGKRLIELHNKLNNLI